MSLPLLGFSLLVGLAPCGGDGGQVALVAEGPAPAGVSWEEVLRQTAAGLALRGTPACTASSSEGRAAALVFVAPPGAASSVRVSVLRSGEEEGVLLVGLEGTPAPGRALVTAAAAEELLFAERPPPVDEEPEAAAVAKPLSAPVPLARPPLGSPLSVGAALGVGLVTGAAALSTLAAVGAAYVLLGPVPGLEGGQLYGVAVPPVVLPIIPTFGLAALALMAAAALVQGPAVALVDVALGGREDGALSLLLATLFGCAGAGSLGVAGGCATFLLGMSPRIYIFARPWGAPFVTISLGVFALALLLQATMPAAGSALAAGLADRRTLHEIADGLTTRAPSAPRHRPTTAMAF